MIIAQNTYFSKKGFTLIELLVVTVIIAVLAIMGIAAFRGFTARGNDARRNADMKAIGDALEANKGSVTGQVGYASLSTSQFASGNIPVDPVGGSSGTGTAAGAGHGGYCISHAVSGTVGLAPTYTELYDANNGCNTIGTATKGADGAGWDALSTSVPTNGATTIWMVCGTTGDLNPSNTNTIVCRNSAQ